MITIKENDRIRHPYPVVAHILGKDQAQAVDALYHYVRPDGDYVLVRSDLDALDQAFRQLEEHLEKRWDGRTWASR